jgi:hypothetical protein
MSGAIQATFMNQRSFGAPPPSAIGDAYEGGYYAGQIGVSSVATHYLVIAPKSSGQSTKQWKNAATDTPNANSDINGEQNTADMVADGNSTVYPAAHFCNDLTIGGYTDWYMPAKNELEVCYYNLKPNTTGNNTNSGINPNAVPARASNYSAVPTQTSVAAFQSGGAQAFDINSYWVSTEDSSNTRGKHQTFDTGYQGIYFKYYSNKVRAVRKVAV